MSKENIDEALEKWQEKAGVADLPTKFTICGCKGTIVTTEDGKRHIELECKSKGDREDVAAIFEEEVVLRVNPRVVLEDNPPAAPAAPAAPEPDTRLNPTES